MKINQRFILLYGCALAAISVMLGAFGAHALKPVLLENNRVETFELAVRYQFYHTFAILLLGALAEKIRPSFLRSSFFLFLLGIILFSGSLYHLSLSNQTTFVLITPLGGMCFISGWIVLLISFWKIKEK